MEKNFSKAGGLFNDERVDKIIETDLTSEIVFSNMSYDELLSSYRELDEDELFDYEKKLIPFTITTPSGVEKAAVVLEGNHARICLSSVSGRDRTSLASLGFLTRMSITEAKACLESKVYEIIEKEFDLSWARLQVPGTYNTEDGFVQVIIGDNNKRYLIKNSEVYDIPSNPSGEITLNEEMTNANGCNPVQRESAEEATNPLESEAFANFRRGIAETFGR